jgi:hypothetical protein
VQRSRSRIVRSIHTIHAEPIIHAIEILEPRGTLRQTVIIAMAVIVDVSFFDVVQNNITRILIFACIPGVIGRYNQ